MSYLRVCVDAHLQAVVVPVQMHDECKCFGARTKQ